MWHRFLVAVSALCLSTACLAQTAFNTVGSDDRTAISGYDPVAFRSVGKALKGDPKFSHDFGGAKWVFVTDDNLKAFQQSPEKYLPAWGGHCAWSVSENGSMSTKLLSGDFAIVHGKLYLFSFGNSRKSSARDDFLHGRWPRDQRIVEGERFWPDLKQKLEDGSRAQPGSKSYSRSRFEESK